MATVPSYKGSDISRVLKRKGFVESTGDHVVLYLAIGGKRTAIRTMVSHGRKEYTDFLWSCLKRQLHLEQNELITLLNCSMSHEEYIDLIQGKGVI